MSQSAVVAVAAAFIVNGLLSWLSVDTMLGMTGISWVISGIVAFAAGYATMNMGKK